MDKGKELDSHSQSDYCQQPSSFGKRCKGLYFTANHINQITVHKNNGHLFVDKSTKHNVAMV